MSKLISATLIVTTLLLTPTNNSQVTLAGTCASNCGAKPLQFTPGQYIRVQVANRTPRVLKLEKLPEMRRITLQPGQEYRVDRESATEPNFSILFWDDTGRSLQANVSKPNFGTLRLELRPSEKFPGYRSLYILNDGKVNVF
ncbi:hypothetical protein H6G54_01450 [Anabaena cylindrica FACHB-243]|uniref:Uncharacterized protein n=1 Tax=Anabaena cylindrica (strain ATCC 27899 / PCC 7122) TaxID=272123 RepID=K9ZPE2_ANACC|nr:MULTISPECIES: hypothetical protein [Anabaena]AFZ60412.1 hypothetical protein Anacy_5073 [Anabaena cylindrica PCC 7122]MBD2416400.1 hypothetical protein [Anabaena cylindrica FACHB-243]MBY5308247.1 hypothetical protein [Anabaena sp. CCAP 1446/1C]MCM2408453.1 hypothetical protein [Anabaena sp. CCAP 1446/1C]BAY02513.1 hypothetical protein NIES19_17580 [Anabaena cylindrica PCC 7122]